MCCLASSMFRRDVLPWLIKPGKEFCEKIDTFVESVLVPGSSVDTEDFLPASHLHHLVSTGLVTVVTSPGSIWNVETRFAITEQLAFGCLDTWFVITQHWGASGIVQRADYGALDLFWDRRSLLGVGFGHLRRSTPCLTANISGNQLSISGFAPWVTGSSWLSWVVYGATLPNGQHVYVRLPHQAADGYKIGQPQSLAAVRRTDTREVFLNLTVSTDYLLCIRAASDLPSQDEVTLVTSIAPILGLIGRCLLDWSQEVKVDNLATFETLTTTFKQLRQNVYAMLTDIGSATVQERLRLRQDVHVLLENIIHIWCLSSGGQSNTRGMMVIRRRQEAAFFRVFQQTKQLKDAAISAALKQMSI